MSTRSIIVVTGQGNYGSEATTRLYKHHDGYPTGILPIIKQAIESMQADITERADRFKDKPEVMNQSGLVGKLIGAASSQHGMGASIDESYSELFKPTMLGLQGDLEWIYIVDTTKKTVGIYGGGYTGDGPQEAYYQGFHDPMAYISNLREECKSDEATETRLVVSEIEALGFTVNKEAKDPKLVAAEKVLLDAEKALAQAKEALIEAQEKPADVLTKMTGQLKDIGDEAKRLGLGKIQTKRFYEAHATINIGSPEAAAKARELIKKYQSKPASV